jgi:tRNA pseudouridine38/39 synthase
MVDDELLVDDDDLPKNELDKIKVWVVPRKKKNKKADDNNEGASATNTGRVEKELSEYPYARILNNLLPPEIRILGWAPVSPEFSARFSATTRTYRYFFAKRPLMDLEPIKQGLQRFVGRHDFRNFCKMDVEKIYNFERLIHHAQVVQTSNDICYLQIHGQAFLWHQIRCIAAVLLNMVGRGVESPEVITELLNVQRYPGKPSYPLADEKPLVLHDCGYPNLQIGYSVPNVWSVSCQLEQKWEELTLAAARVRNGIQSLEEEVSVLKEDLVQFATGKLAERQKKQQKKQRSASGAVGSDDQPMPLVLELDDDDVDQEEAASTATISWAKALPWLLKHGLVPDSNGLNTAIHVPLLQRSKGTTYEEKVEALQKSDKRRQKFEENVIKKRKTAEEDAAFHKHKIKQGGAGM